MKPYYEDEHVRLYHGDCREVLPTLDVAADLIVTDPPYGETSLAWDRWPTGWPAFVAPYASAMWCFGSMRMFLDRRDEFAGWKFSQDVVWDKGRGTGPVVDRFRRVHEHALMFYQGTWRDVFKIEPRSDWHGERRAATREAGSVVAAHRNLINKRNYEWVDDGTRITESIVRVRNLHRQGAINETQKPLLLTEMLLAYSCPSAGLVLDVFAGSSTTLLAARMTGRRAVGIELRESQCEQAARRLDQGVLDFEAAT